MLMLSASVRPTRGHLSHRVWFVLLLVLQALASVQPPQEKKVEKEEEVKPPSPTRPKIETTEVSGASRLMHSCCGRLWKPERR